MERIATGAVHTWHRYVCSLCGLISQVRLGFSVPTSDCVGFSSVSIMETWTCVLAPRGSTLTRWVHRWENGGCRVSRRLSCVCHSRGICVREFHLCHIWKGQLKGGAVYFWLMVWEIFVHRLWQHGFGSLVKLGVKMAGQQILEDAIPLMAERKGEHQKDPGKDVTTIKFPVVRLHLQLHTSSLKCSRLGV